MTANAEELELKDRLSLIETMIAEGRRTTESWGWTFVLWGVAYYVAIAWDSLGPQSVGLAGHHDSRLAADAWLFSGARQKQQPAQKPRLGRADDLFHLDCHGHLDVCCSFLLWASAAGSHLHIFVAMVRRHAGHGQCGLQHDSQVEDAVCLRGGLVGGELR